MTPVRLLGWRADVLYVVRQRALNGQTKIQKPTMSQRQIQQHRCSTLTFPDPASKAQSQGSVCLGHTDQAPGALATAARVAHFPEEKSAGKMAALLLASCSGGVGQ